MARTQIRLAYYPAFRETSTLCTAILTDGCFQDVNMKRVRPITADIAFEVHFEDFKIRLRSWSGLLFIKELRFQFLNYFGFNNTYFDSSQSKMEKLP